METEMFDVQAQLDRIEKKVDDLHTLEVRVAKLEVQAIQQSETAKEVAGLRTAAGLREEVAVLRGKVEVLDKGWERRQGVTDGVKLVWLALAGAPGMLAIAGLLYWVSRYK